MMRHGPILILFAVLATLAGCAAYPDLPESADAASRDAYPRLIPLADLLVRAETAPLSSPGLERDLRARAARLRARAALMRGRAVGEADIARMRAAVARQGD